ncbi:MAG: hypothetical protein EOS70_06945 [Mesorhizobium sp.]|uniref:hypothetical protein n=1 Tax=Mesorhizobium sp. TaxID=1871066 RepID=UPI000FE53E84|nr:hypothetical protein [Mesorhizobium sp.]RWC36155.1 MAG: hypothetical protein EOS70_06945 [Mesorhizobium sp.]
MIIRTAEEADGLMTVMRASAARARSWIAAQTGDPLEMLKRMKFEPIGFHPVEDRPLNLVEQINQTWTFAVAIAAAKLLLTLHPDVGGFQLAPGAHAALDLDIMSIEPGQVGAETFAAVTPRNNNKLDKDLAKLASRPEAQRYVFFMSPVFPGNRRCQRSIGWTSCARGRGAITESGATSEGKGASPAGRTRSLSARRRI